ncbi:acyl-CoA dehydrogenase family protein [Coralloluteibacterium stylophorae]|uniref:Acyl-CoA dehydrogenase family protein n=1 Tax=Coralloluteibacterium stylophorae TaxID=1776034 RepID=A0A8J7VV05_9GAMM|nr:acyl-CoA dehydrogenase family protein [Coralloluteibacterium stylophorae]MBS7458627.1 acyl-CoA dehydrogenase family protein [Coralloluteibacterium stylophorae]
MSEFSTHRVENQPPPFAPFDLWQGDAVLQATVARNGGAWGGERLSDYARAAGEALHGWALDANRDRPRLVTHDGRGHRVDRVEFHPHYHRLMRAGVEGGIAGLPWREQRAGAHVVRAALMLLHHEVEQGTSCPLTMTYAAQPALRREPALAEWAAKAAAPHYDGRDLPMVGKAGVTIGMGMTEKQGGSDVRANSTRATPDGDGYALVGHKWFFSAPMSDAWLVLAQAPGGLSCFLVPRWRPDGERNALRLMRLKDKLGNWSNASSEVEFTGALGLRIGEEGRGVATIIEMVALTRLDCMLGAAAQMRMALAIAVHHARHRRTFGRPLLEHALMRNVLADLALESEAALALALRVAQAVDAAPRDPREAAFARVATAIGKYWLCRRAAAFVNEAQECLGGAGYVEESPLARLYREAPLNSIWEGSGNVQCLDVLRALAREPATRDVLLAEIDQARGLHPAFDPAADALRAAMEEAKAAEFRARSITERAALVLQAAILLRAARDDAGIAPVADAFCRSRLDGRHGLAMGTLDPDVDAGALIARAPMRTF